MMQNNQNTEWVVKPKEKQVQLFIKTTLISKVLMKNFIRVKEKFNFHLSNNEEGFI
jgi:hypothetical protein